MSGDARPPARSTHTLATLGGSWSYDTWGRNGRPVIFLHAILFDRAMWWPVAAELRAQCTAVAVDLPGHGTSPARSRYHPDALVEDLAHLLHDLGATQAPIIVGHGASAGLAVLFAARYVTHAVITVDAADLSGGPTPAATATGDYLSSMGAHHLPPYYRTLATARPESALLAGYADCLPEALKTAQDSPPRTTRQHRHLAVYSQQPQSAARYPLTVPSGHWRSEVYDVPGRFAHLLDVHRFASDVRSELSATHGPA
jgi:pimeloyl-ACP methyl ester carboxylesterase